MVNYILPCLFHFKRVTLSGKMMFRIQFEKIRNAISCQTVVLIHIQVGINSDTYLIDILSALVRTNDQRESVQCNQPIIKQLVTLQAMLSYRVHSLGFCCQQEFSSGSSLARFNEGESMLSAQIFIFPIMAISFLAPVATLGETKERGCLACPVVTLSSWLLSILLLWTSFEGY